MPHPGLLHPEPLPCSRPLLTCTSTADTQTQFCLRLCGVSGSWCTRGLFESSEPFWWVWGLILNENLPLLCLAGAFPLFLDVGYLLRTTPVLQSNQAARAPVPTILLGFFCLWTRGISSQLLSAAAAADGDFRQNMVHGRREWQTTSVSLPWESHEKAKR